MFHFFERVDEVLWHSRQLLPFEEQLRGVLVQVGGVGGAQVGDALLDGLDAIADALVLKMNFPHKIQIDKFTIYFTRWRPFLFPTSISLSTQRLCSSVRALRSAPSFLSFKWHKKYTNWRKIKLFYLRR